MHEEHRQYLDLLSIFHYIVGGAAALFGLFPFIHLIMGVGMMVASVPNGFSGSGMESLFGIGMGCFVFFMALTLIACIWGYAAAMFAAGRYLKEERKHLFCMATAGVSCMFVPFGTVLGIFTLILLLKDDVKEAFGVPQGSVATSESTVEIQ